MSSPSSLIRAATAVCLVLPAGVALAQGAIKPIEARIVNTASNPVPVVGTVTLGGGGVTGTLKSGDKTVTLHDAAVQVTTTVFANHGTGQLDVADYKEVRIAVAHGQCSPCGDVAVAVFASAANGFPYQIDEFVVTLPPFGSGGVTGFASKTYGTPGSRLSVALRTTAPGSSNSVRVALFGRAN